MLIILCNMLNWCIRIWLVDEINDTFYFPFLLKIQHQLINIFFIFDGCLM